MQGTDGEKGEPGKSAYEYAREAGYEGTEEEFSDKLNGEYALKSEIPSVDGFATEEYVDAKVFNLINSAPEALDTLNELAAALGNDVNFAATVTNSLAGKVDKVSGKDLSTNDFTDEYKSKVDSALQAETDPTVPAWAKEPTKPTYTAAEVGALPADTAIPKEDFVAIYGETTYEEIMTAHNAGRTCWIKMDSAIVPVMFFYADRVETFSLDNFQSNKRITCGRTSGWSSGVLYNERIDNKIQAISSTPSTTKYPSEKAVYDALSQKSQVQITTWEADD